MDKRIVVKTIQVGKRKDSIRYIMKCLVCKKTFYILPRDYRRGRGIYCGKICNGKRKFGIYNGCWKGGKKISRGYKLIHKNLVKKKYHYLIQQSFYVPEHRLVAAKKYKKRLKSDDIIHHLNGIKTDNRSENLTITNSNNHERKTVEKLLKQRIRKLEKQNM